MGIKINQLIDDKPRRGNLQGRTKIVSEVIHQLIINQHKLSTFAVYGDWGTGKTSICKTVYDNLNLSNTQKVKNNTEYFYIPVWFEAWRYQNEKYIYPALLRTIATKLISKTNDSKINTLAKDIVK